MASNADGVQDGGTGGRGGLPPQDVLPFPPTPSASIAGRTMQESVYAQRVAAAPAARGRAEHPDRADRRCRARASRPRSAARCATDTLTRILERGHRVQPVPHHGDVLADAGVAADRPEPPPGRQRPDRRAGQRLGRLLRPHPQEQRARRRGAAELRLRDGGVGQVAQHARRGDHARPGRSTTGRPASASSTSTASSPARRRSTSRTWCATRPVVLPPKTPEEGYHLSEDLADDAIGWLHQHKAFEPDKPFFMYWASGCHARPAPHHEGVGGQVRRQVRRRLGRLPRAGLRAGQGEGLDPAGRAADAARPDAAGMGRHPRGREAVPAPADGGRGRLRRARRRAGRPAGRRGRAARLRRQHADLLHLGRQRLVGRGPERHDQRAAGPERHPDDGRHAHRGARGARRPRRARLAEDRQPVPRRLGVGRQHAVQGA